MPAPDQCDPCAAAPVALLLEGVRFFNAQEYFACHEVLEAAWNADRTPFRILYKGILQVGVGCYHLLRRNYHGAVVKLRAGADYLEPFAPICATIDVATLIADARRLCAAVESAGPEAMETVPRALLPIIQVQGAPHDPQQIAARLGEMQACIAAAARRAGRDPAGVMLVAVTKTLPAAVVQAGYDLGLRTFGENRVQEARDKIAVLDLPDARWEMIGALQRNKVRAALDLFARIQSVESMELAEAIEAEAARRDQIMPVLVEVNVGGEATKHGVTPDAVPHLARAIQGMAHLRGEGLMTVAPPAQNPETVRPIFRTLRQMRDQVQRELGDSWRECSMGMSDDFGVAIEEGATIVRLGRALFGERPAT
jgi:PLP dependent protein